MAKLENWEFRRCMKQPQNEPITFRVGSLGPGSTDQCRLTVPEQIDRHVEPVSRDRSTTTGNRQMKKKDDPKCPHVPYTVKPFGAGCPELCRALMKRADDIRKQPPQSQKYPLRVLVSLMPVKPDAEAILLEVARQHDIRRYQWTHRWETDSMIKGRVGREKEMIFVVTVSNPQELPFLQESWKVLYRASALRSRNKARVVWHTLSRSEEVRLIILATFAEKYPHRASGIPDNHQLAVAQIKVILEAWEAKGVQKAVEDVLEWPTRAHDEIAWIKETL